MRLFYFMLAAAAVLGSCQLNDDSDSEIDPAASVATVIRVNQPTDSRVAVEPDGIDEEWVMTWEDGDDMACWTTGGSTLNRFEIMDISDDGTSASFGGDVQPNSTLRMIYPYDASATVTSGGQYEVDLSYQRVDLDDSYNSMAEEKMYMVSDLVSIGADGTSSDIPYMNHMMSAVEFHFTPSSNLDAATYDYTLYEVEIYIKSYSNAYASIYTKGYIDLSQDDAVFVGDESSVGVMTIEIANSPVLSLDQTVVIPIIIAPTTMKKIGYATAYLSVIFKVNRTNRATGVVAEDSCTAYKAINTTYNLLSGTYNTIIAQGGDASDGFGFSNN